MDEMQDIYRQYAQPVYRYLLGLCGNAHDAEELTAETFYQATKSIGRFRGECKLLTWLCQIGKRAWYKELERRGKKPAPLDEAPEIAAGGLSTEEAVEAAENKLALYRRMQRLDDATREVMYLRLTGELSFGEIGDVLGKSENWARVTFYRGKEKLKDYDRQQ